MVDGKNESGYVLLYALGAIVLISILIGGIFLVARTVFFQVDKVDQFKRVKEMEEYALQNGTSQIQKDIELYIADLETIDFGNDVSIISRDMDTLFASFECSEFEIGSNKQFSYITKINKISKEKTTPYVLTTLNGSYGWEKDTSVMNSSRATNTKLTFEIESEITEQQKDGTLKTSIAKASYVYEIQWNDIDIADELNELDIWRNVVYSYYLPNSAGYLSADEWMRKMDALYRFNSIQTVFNYTDYDNTKPLVDGYSNGHLVDITDGKGLNFTSTGKAIRSPLTFEGSLLFEKSIELEGGTSSSKLVINNLFSLRNSDLGKNSIQNLEIIANNGTYIDFTGQGGYLAINEQDASFSTSGLLINHTPTGGAVESGGVVFGSGELVVQTQPGTHDFSFANYSSSAASKSPKDSYWNEFVKGSAVIASSNFYAGPLNVSTDIQSTEDDFRQINIDGNFLLTNAMLDSNTGEEGFSYFQDSSVNTSNSPSTLTLDGKNTSFQVVGKSFIDAPKTERRKSLTEGASEEINKFYGDKKDWNSITLKNEAVMDLGYVGIEPFNLSISAGSVFSAKVLPELSYFDTSFLANGVSEGTLKGKVILQTFNQKDADDLKAKLESQKIPVSVVTENENAKNAEVTIVKPSNPAGVNTSQIISRTFSYLNEVDY